MKVCEWLGPGYTSINSEKNVFNPHNSVTKFFFFICFENLPPTHINGMYVCVLGIPKGKFSKQMKKKNLVTELWGLNTFFPEFIASKMFTKS
jgi:hypothetical protein